VLPDAPSEEATASGEQLLLVVLEHALVRDAGSEVVVEALAALLHAAAESRPAFVARWGWVGPGCAQQP
jgi:hypothetical protein